MTQTPKRTKKSPARKAKVAPKKATTPRPKKKTPDERHRLIAMAAYRRAVAHGAHDRDPMRDWLEAEAEVDAKLAAGSGTAKAPRKRR